MKKKIKSRLIYLIAIYMGLCIFLFFAQERLLFFPTKLSKEHKFSFETPFEELDFTTDDGVTLNTVLFHSKEKKGVVLLLHGNGGTINGWGLGAELYTSNGYDVMYLDYRGYGKSGGKITSETQLIQDAQMIYDYLKFSYGENNLILTGISIGTGIAAKLAANNSPKKLVLNSPYSSLKKLAGEKVVIFPSFIVKYKMETDKHLKEVNCPTFIFHGSADKVIPYKHSISLKKENPDVELYILEGFGHNDLSGSKEYRQRMKEILN